MAEPSRVGGMGAVLQQKGCSFRVWAPNVAGLAVRIWSPGHATRDVALAREQAPGYWSAFVPAVRAGDEYRFILKAFDGATFSRMDPYCRDATSSAGNSVVCDLSYDWGPATFQMPGWNELVIYEMHVGTFNVQAGGVEGTFESVKARLADLQDLGINAIQILPAYEFDNDASMGYNPALPFAIESAYGQPKAVQDLVKAAHARGIAVIFDVVYNHWGIEGLGECLWQFDGWNQDGHGGIYFYNDDRRHTPWGERPDYGRPEVRAYIRDNAMMWLREYQVDGLRWDSTGCVRMNRGFCGGHCCGESLGDGWNLMRWVNDEKNHYQPWKYSIAEDLFGVEAISEPTSRGGAGFDAQWDPDFIHPLRNAVKATWDGERSMSAVRNALLHTYRGDPWARITYFESHNEATKGRLVEEISPGAADGWLAKKKSLLAAGILFTAPGVPMIFQGQELLAWGRWSEKDPLDWEHRKKYASYVAAHRDLIRLRRNWWNNTRGLKGRNINVHHVNDGDKLVAYHRWDRGGPGDDVVVVANFADRSYDSYRIGLPRGGRWHVRYNGDAQVYDPWFGNKPGYDTDAHYPGADGMPTAANIGIGPYSVVILSQ